MRDDLFHSLYLGTSVFGSDKLYMDSTSSGTSEEKSSFFAVVRWKVTLNVSITMSVKKETGMKSSLKELNHDRLRNSPRKLLVKSLFELIEGSKERKLRKA